MMLAVVALVVAVVALGVALYALFAPRPQSLIQLAEFSGLHPDLKQLWRVNVTDGMMPVVIDAINAEYDKLSDVKKQQMRMELEAGVLEAKTMVVETLSPSQMLRMATKAPVRMIRRTVAPRAVRSPASTA